MALIFNERREVRFEKKNLTHALFLFPLRALTAVARAVLCGPDGGLGAPCGVAPPAAAVAGTVLLVARPARAAVVQAPPAAAVADAQQGASLFAIIPKDSGCLCQPSLHALKQA
jgi:hypothetical protein